MERTRSVTKAAKILSLLSSGVGDLGVTEIGANLGIPKSSTHSICRELADAGLLERISSAKYRLGPAVLALAEGYRQRVSPERVFEEEAAKIGELSRRTLVLGKLYGGDVVYVATVDGEEGLGVRYRVGTRLPANCTATGKALLSGMDPDDLQRWISVHSPLPLRTKQSKSGEALLEDVEQIQERGYAIDDEETSPGMCCFGAPVVNELGEVTAAVGVSVVRAALRDEDFEDALPKGIQKLALALSPAVKL